MDLLISFILIYASLQIIIFISISEEKPIPYKKLNVFWMGYRLYKASYLRRKKINIFQYLYFLYFTNPLKKIISPLKKIMK